MRRPEKELQPQRDDRYIKSVLEEYVQDFRFGQVVMAQLQYKDMSVGKLLEKINLDYSIFHNLVTNQFKKKALTNVFYILAIADALDLSPARLYSLYFYPELADESFYRWMEILERLKDLPAEDQGFTMKLVELYTGPARPRSLELLELINRLSDEQQEMMISLVRFHATGEGHQQRQE